MQNIKNILSNDIIKIILAFIFTFLLLLLFSKLDNTYTREGELYITEIMTKNTYTVKDSDNSYSDYIELYNGYGKDINLEGFHLSDSEFETNKWTFPDIVIKANSYLVVYASGKDKCDNEKNVCHTNFKLSSKGEVITLTDKNGNILNKFTYPNISNDLAYGYINGGYNYLNDPSPGKENKEKLKYSKISNKELYINEYMSSNKRSNYDSNGSYNDFVELYNNSGEDLDLKNIYLTDKEDNLMKYKIPNVTLKKNDYLLILLSDKSKVVDNLIYANFKLGDDDKYLILSNGKDILEKIELVKLIDNVSLGKKDDKWLYFTKPTPGYENNTHGLEEIK